MHPSFAIRPYDQNWSLVAEPSVVVKSAQKDPCSKTPVCFWQARAESVLSLGIDCKNDQLIEAKEQNESIMKRTLILAAACLAASLAQAAPPIPLDQLQLRVTYRPCDAPGVGLVGNSMYNPRFFDGSVYAPQINIYCWASFPRGSSIPSAAVLETTRQTRMVAPIPGTTYLLASGGSLMPFHPV